MRRSREAKAETHEAIVNHAARLFRERGVDRTSVADVMDAARKTHGGFYRHFASKEALLSAALQAAFAEMTDLINTGFAQTPAEGRLDGFAGFYLSPKHLNDPSTGCPVAALAGEVARGTDAIRRDFGTGARRMIEALAEAFDGPPIERRRRAAQVFAMAAGALMIARAADAETADVVLAAAREGVTRL